MTIDIDKYNVNIAHASVLMMMTLLLALLEETKNNKQQTIDNLHLTITAGNTKA